jgi:hypothetical protein
MTDKELDRAIEIAKIRFLAKGGKITKIPAVPIPPSQWTVTNKPRSGSLAGCGNYHAAGKNGDLLNMAK